ncbi:hypothetical protein [Caryophanon latum]|uniref:Uncharacterized protein n=1 Tax=Caryophanon latum TaxID=33977 RepID=A0A1C0YTJ5_9BACL|nr:hypothetical protein [Caryophanon latum]OCS90480.1 hypothetical protein A6K76_11485 [Caryophanon latum]
MFFALLALYSVAIVALLFGGYLYPLVFIGLTILVAITIRKAPKPKEKGNMLLFLRDVAGILCIVIAYIVVFTNYERMP